MDKARVYFMNFVCIIISFMLIFFNIGILTHLSFNIVYAEDTVPPYDDNLAHQLNFLIDQNEKFMGTPKFILGNYLAQSAFIGNYWNGKHNAMNYQTQSVAYRDRGKLADTQLKQVYTAQMSNDFDEGRNLVKTFNLSSEFRTQVFAGSNQQIPYTANFKPVGSATLMTYDHVGSYTTSEGTVWKIEAPKATVDIDTGNQVLKNALADSSSLGLFIYPGQEPIYSGMVASTVKLEGTPVLKQFEPNVFEYTTKFPVIVTPSVPQGASARTLEFTARFIRPNTQPLFYSSKLGANSTGTDVSYSVSEGKTGGALIRMFDADDQSMQVGSTLSLNNFDLPVGTTIRYGSQTLRTNGTETQLEWKNDTVLNDTVISLPATAKYRGTPYSVTASIRDFDGNVLSKKIEFSIIPDPAKLQATLNDFYVVEGKAVSPQTITIQNGTEPYTTNTTSDLQGLNLQGTTISGTANKILDWNTDEEARVFPLTITVTDDRSKQGEAIARMTVYRELVVTKNQLQVKDKVPVAASQAVVTTNLKSSKIEAKPVGNTYGLSIDSDGNLSGQPNVTDWGDNEQEKTISFEVTVNAPGDQIWKDNVQVTINKNVDIDSDNVPDIDDPDPTTKTEAGFVKVPDSLEFQSVELDPAINKYEVSLKKEDVSKQTLISVDNRPSSNGWSIRAKYSVLGLPNASIKMDVTESIFSNGKYTRNVSQEKKLDSTEKEFSKGQKNKGYKHELTNFMLIVPRGDQPLAQKYMGAIQWNFVDGP